MASFQTREREVVDSPAHLVLGLVALLMAAVMGGIASGFHISPSGVPAAAGDHTNRVAAATE